MDATKFQELVNALQSAKEEYVDAKERLAFARKEECEAVNALNAVQQAFDEAVSEIRSEINGGDWARSKQAEGGK